MANLVDTYQLIADILSFEQPTSELEKTLKNHATDWDLLVVEGSKHLILPTIYCRLKSKKFLSLIPNELEHYLQELSSINRNRNNAILNQVKTISTLFNANNIDSVFLKGTALLVSGIYTDNAERMIGDIDILITKDQSKNAFELLLRNGYTATPTTLGNDFFEHKHLPRLVSKGALCAVEIHNKLFVNYEYKDLSANAIFKEKQCLDAISIPSEKALLFHNILNFQINDNGNAYNSINFRAAYDSLLLLQNKNDKSLNASLKTGLFLNYFRYLSLFFDEIQSNLNIIPSLYSSFYLFRLKNKFLHNLWIKIQNTNIFIKILAHRLYIFMINENYRKAVIKDRVRIFNHLKTFLILRDS